MGGLEAAGLSILGSKTEVMPGDQPFEVVCSLAFPANALALNPWDLG